MLSQGVSKKTEHSLKKMREKIKQHSSAEKDGSYMPHSRHRVRSGFNSYFEEYEILAQPKIEQTLCGISAVVSSQTILAFLQNPVKRIHMNSAVLLKNL